MAPCSKRATPYTIGDFILGLSGKGKQDIYSSQPNLLSLPNHKIFKKSHVVLRVYVYSIACTQPRCEDRELKSLPTTRLFTPSLCYLRPSLRLTCDTSRDKRSSTTTGRYGHPSPYSIP